MLYQINQASELKKTYNLVKHVFQLCALLFINKYGFILNMFPENEVN